MSEYCFETTIPERSLPISHKVCSNQLQISNFRTKNNTVRAESLFLFTEETREKESCISFVEWLI